MILAPVWENIRYIGPVENINFLFCSKMRSKFERIESPAAIDTLNGFLNALNLPRGERV